MSVDAEMMRSALIALAPGTKLRDGLERIQRGHTGALIVLGDTEASQSICSGGFDIDIELTGARLRELAKMDGAVIVSEDAERITKANVQLIPDSTIFTAESGMRHRAAERTARQTGQPVITVSASMRVITVFVGSLRKTLVEPEALLSRANLALNTLERYKQRLEENVADLSILEHRDAVTLREVTTCLQRIEMMRRIHSEISGYLEELGSEGRLIALQLDDLARGLATERFLLIRDYIRLPDHYEQADRALAELDGESLVNLGAISATLGHIIVDGSDLDRAIVPRGIRVLSRVPRLPKSMIENISGQWDSLPKLREVTNEDLQQIEGVGPYRASVILDALERQHQAALLEDASW